MPVECFDVVLSRHMRRVYGEYCIVWLGCRRTQMLLERGRFHVSVIRRRSIPASAASSSTCGAEDRSRSNICVYTCLATSYILTFVHSFVVYITSSSFLQLFLLRRTGRFAVECKRGTFLHFWCFWCWQRQSCCRIALWTMFRFFYFCAI